MSLDTFNRLVVAVFLGSRGDRGDLFVNTPRAHDVIWLAWSTMRFMCGDQESSSDNGHIDSKISNLRSLIKNPPAPWDELVT